MADWQEQLNTILSDPDAMAQIASLAQSLSGQTAEDGSPPPPPTPEPPKPGADAAALLSGIKNLDPELLRRLVPLMGQLNRPESGETSAFLHALRPFLSEKRRGKVERAAQLARLIHLGKTFLTTPEEGARHV